MHRVAVDRDLYLENYWLKNRRSVNKGKRGPIFAWVIPASQRRKAGAADMVNQLRHQGLEIHRADTAYNAGTIEVAVPGDYIIRADQPYRTMADMYLSVQNYPPQNPRPYDDTGWTMQYMRNVKVTPVKDKSILDRAMTLLKADARPSGGIDGWGGILLIDHTTDNALMAFRFRHKDVKMLVAEEDFEESGHKWRAGAFIIPEAGPCQTRTGTEGNRFERVGSGGRFIGQDARVEDPADRLRAFLVEHPGRGLGARGARRVRNPVHLFCGSEAARVEPAHQVRRDYFSAYPGHIAGDYRRDSQERQKRIRFHTANAI